MMATRQTACGAGTMFTALLLYAAYVGPILYRMCKMMTSCRLIGFTGSSAASREATLTILGHVFPVTELALVGSFLPLTLFVFPIYSTLRRRYREKHDLCTECGRAIDDWHGRCPGCGVRLGPDAGVVVHVIRG